jgi:hypothetical protein
MKALAAMLALGFLLAGCTAGGFPSSGRWERGFYGSMSGGSSP